MNLGTEIRRALRASFPDTRFSVRKQAGRMELWYTVDWTDGPADYRVEEVAAGFDSVITQRKISPEFRARIDSAMHREGRIWVGEAAEMAIADYDEHSVRRRITRLTDA